jgi:toxin ParE1/3/4
LPRSRLTSREAIQRAATFVRELRAHCQGLPTFPAARPSRPELGEGVRLSVFGNYVVLYVLRQDILEIRRVVHGARDLADID